MLGSANPSEEIKVGGQSRSKALIGVLMIISAVVLYAFFSRALAADLSVKKESLATQQGKLDKLNVQIKDFQEAEAKLGSAGEVEKLTLLNAVPIGLQEDNLIRDLVNIATDNGIDLGSVSFAKGGVVQEGVGSLTISAGFEGSYDDLMNFLQSVETNKRKLRVNSISVQISRLEGSTFERVNFALSMEAFYQLENK